ncbi:MAG TPA: 4Fe-4S binding protein [archaeon]|nr:4Fe-4S binding protein [archaeon]
MLKINHKKCVRCTGCISVCPFDALEMAERLDVSEKCTDCGICVKFCPVGALKVEKK